MFPNVANWMNPMTAFNPMTAVNPWTNVNPWTQFSGFGQVPFGYPQTSFGFNQIPFGFGQVPFGFGQFGSGLDVIDPRIIGLKTLSSYAPEIVRHQAIHNILRSVNPWAGVDVSSTYLTPLLTSLPIVKRMRKLEHHHHVRSLVKAEVLRLLLKWKTIKHIRQPYGRKNWSKKILLNQLLGGGVGGLGGIGGVGGLGGFGGVSGFGTDVLSNVGDYGFGKKYLLRKLLKGSKGFGKKSQLHKLMGISGIGSNVLGSGIHSNLMYGNPLATIGY